MSGPSTHPEPRHLAVMPAEVLKYLEPLPGQTLVDATTGAGGHSRLLAERVGPTGRLICIDQDESMLALAASRLEGFPVTLVHDNFDRLGEVLERLQVERVDGVLADLGVCSDQLDQAERGLSFQQSGPLDMRLDQSQGEPASDLLERLSERELADLIWKYGEERNSRRIARKIVETRKQVPLQRTDDLAALVRRCVPVWRSSRGKGIDPATRVFQALRIAVNDELGSLERFLECIPRRVRPGGRVVVISFHSLEDRRVKHALRDRETWEVLTKKPIQAGEEETRDNPRARSAKLRAARRKEIAPPSELKAMRE